ncbi:hypothetical protein [Paraburkholderia domus]|uniref:hypothetical protein n=1 Tax=Paraburkholderia domus TaxID=2793075 RepID=UPI00191244F9|nr:hypothetical protein [Paraburkholderia domus]MBK5066307.1 hypothetical protein [Burkholderia sp. R-70199]CAE6969325.1 hypothetical protein R70199_08049 [Paraburkholderia domus]
MPIELGLEWVDSLAGIRVGKFSSVKNSGGQCLHVLRKISNTKNIKVTSFSGFALPEVASIVEVFDSANILAETSTLAGARYNVRLLSAAGGRVASSSSVAVCTINIEACRQADTLHALFITGGKGLHRNLHDTRLINWLRLTSQRTRYICPNTGGKLVLEAAGLTRFGGGHRRADSTGVGPEPCGTELPVDFKSPLQQALAVVQADLGPEIAGQIAARAEPFFQVPFSTFRKDTSGLLSE